MRCTLKFYNEILARAVKINNVRADTVLPPEFSAFNLRPLKNAPQHGFRWCQA
jgi:hypothetical protein